MHYLIDGHNLIAQMDEIDLSDPDDEAQLILRLRQWIAAGRKRRVTVYFDGGLPGGEARNLSGTRLRVFFASGGGNADTMMIKKIRRVQNPPEYTLVTNDREIIDVARGRKMPHMPADEFAQGMAMEAAERAEPDPAPQAEEPALSEAEVAEWLEMFGPEPEVPQRRSRRRGGQASRSRKTETEEENAQGGAQKKQHGRQEPVRPADELKESGAVLSEAEVAAWLDEFGPVEGEARQAAGEDEGKPAETRKQIRRRRQERRQPPRPADEMKASGAKLSEDEVETWLDIFADPEDDEG